MPPPDLIANGFVPRRRERILVDSGRPRLFSHTALVARRSTRWGDPIQATCIHPTRYGGWSNRRRDAYLHQCFRLLDAADVPWSEGADDFEPSSWDGAGDSECRCPDCGGPLQLVAEAHRPS